MSSRRVVAVVAIAFMSGCGVHAASVAPSLRDPRAGRAPLDFSRGSACGTWESATHDARAIVHDSFPEADPRASCFVAIHEGGAATHPDPTPLGCGYPDEKTNAALVRAAERYERVAGGDEHDLPPVLACKLSPEDRRAAARANAATFRALAASIDPHHPAPYSAISAFGYGREEQSAGSLVSFRPGDACHEVSAGEERALSVNVVRAARAAAAFDGGVAPVITFSGGAVHSRAVEAFLLTWAATCRYGIPKDRVLVDPCADHTHVNLKNTGRLVIELGGRTAYVVTDDGWQSDYLEEWNLFSLIGGSIDQRSIRDFGYLVGSWRRASIGARFGFWYTPYRFWAEPREGLGSFTCVE
jgi:hypothetical protein